MRLVRTHWLINDRSSLTPFSNSFDIDVVMVSNGFQAFLTILYCSTQRRCRSGAGIRSAGRLARRLFHRRSGHEPKLYLRFVGRHPGFSLGRSRERRIRPGGNLADPKSKAGPVFEKPLRVVAPAAL